MRAQGEEGADHSPKMTPRKMAEDHKIPRQMFGTLLLCQPLSFQVFVKGGYAGSCLPSVFKGDFHSGL